MVGNVQQRRMAQLICAWALTPLYSKSTRRRRRAWKAAGMHCRAIGYVSLHIRGTLRAASLGIGVAASAGMQACTAVEQYHHYRRLYSYSYSCRGPHVRPSVVIIHTGGAAQGKKEKGSAHQTSYTNTGTRTSCTAALVTVYRVGAGSLKRAVRFSRVN